MSSPQFDLTLHFGDRLSTIYDRRIGLFCPSYDALHRMIVPWVQGLPENSTVLSAGAGTGTEVVTLGGRFPGWRFVAVDASIDMLDACRKRTDASGITERVAFFHGRLQDYPSSASFDAASSIFVAHFIRDRQEKQSYFHSIAANLKPGGSLVIADLFGDKNSPEFVRLLNSWLLSYASHGISPEELARDRAHVETDVDFISENELFFLLSEAGFGNPLRFYQTYLFGGWVATKRA